jgi:general stress protein 26
MDNRIIEFLNTQRIASLTTLLSDGTPHAAALHYSYTENPFTIYFSTDNTSRKFQGLVSNNETKAAIAIGFSEEDWLTFQLEGTVRKVANKTELESVQKIHYTKYPNSAKYKDEPETVFLAFTPTWWRFSDFNTDPETIISS